MTFSEKLLQLRKEKGYSQEVLAEKLGTTRQAVSKWENGQGFPETEKLLMIGNLFEVSVDYLLKESEVKGGVDERGYYVSQEMAEGYLSHQQKSTNRIASGVFLLIMACLPYLMFRQEVVYSFLIILLAAGGVITLISAILKDEERYHVLEKEALMLDQGYVKQLMERLNRLKSRYATVIIVGAGMLVVGGMAFLLERKGISGDALVPYYPVCVVLIAMGAYAIIRTSMLWSSYSLLIYNEKHINWRNNGFWRKVRKRIAKKLGP